jgi:5-methylcytosine-specific restriction endonuclease McrA
LIRGWTHYYGWANCRTRLDYLDHYADRCFWRVMVEKFRIRGIRRPRYVARRYFITKASESPYRRTWHLHESWQERTERGRNSTKIWMIYSTNMYKLQPIRFTTLTKDLREKSYYLHKEKFDAHRIKVYRARTKPGGVSLQEEIWYRQKGKCKLCLKDLIKENKWEVHHIIPIRDARGYSKAQLNAKSNLVILHTECHRALAEGSFSKDELLKIGLIGNA